VFAVLLAFGIGILAEKNCPVVQKYVGSPACNCCDKCPCPCDCGCCEGKDCDCFDCKCKCGCGDTGVCDCCKKKPCCKKKCNKCSKIDRIEAQEIVLSVPGSENKVTLKASKDFAGIWVSNDKKCISIYADDSKVSNGQAFVGILNDWAKASPDGCDVAIGASDSGPVLQMIDKDKKISMFSRSDISRK
jgi:hypothetical protein